MDPRLSPIFQAVWRRLLVTAHVRGPETLVLVAAYHLIASAAVSMIESKHERNGPIWACR
jgi:hypothetical protein